MFDRRHFLSASAATALHYSWRARAEVPAKLIKIVIPYPAGSVLDILARTAADRLGAGLSRTTIVENLGGANGNIGTEVVARSTTDGSMLLLTSMAIVVNKYLYPRLGWSPDDFRAVSIICKIPNVLMVPANAPYRTIEEFVQFARANPDKLTYGSSGTGSSFHLFTELFMRATGIRMRHIPYRGSVNAMQDLIGGHVDVFFGTVASSLGNIEAGDVKALAVTSRERIPVLSNIPTVAETILPEFETASWYGIFVPAKTPPEVLNDLTSEVRMAFATPEVRDRFEKTLGIVMTNLDNAASEQFMKSEMIRWGGIIQQAGITP